ncbi:MAG: hypothetical protein COA94_08765 [Rickettsiales bacterium]|nr:MAG: hypothetical protein COA94_08765 [Rickettsiales bacterium]
MFGAQISLDMIIVIGFLVLTLIVGMGHGKNVKTIKDYALGGRNFSTAALVATIVATWASGSSFFITMSMTYSDGLYDTFAVIGGGISFLIEAFFIIPRMGEFLGKVSIAEAMGDLYGKKVRVITAIAGTIGAAGIIAVQFKVFGNIFSYFLHIPAYVAIVAAGFIATLYSAFGGIRAVTFTDILQFLAFGIIIPVVGFIIWNAFYAEGLSFDQAITDPKFNLGILLDTSNPGFVGMIFMFCYFCVPTMSAPAFQRVAIGRDVAQVKKAFIIAGLIFIVIQIVSAWIPFLIYSINPSLETSHLLGYIVDTYAYPGLKGLIIVAIIALSMSTADSRINAASVLFTNDICKVFVAKLKRELLITRSFAFLLGAISIVLALIETDLIGVVVFANSFYYPIVTPPFLLTVFGFRSTSKSVLIGMAAGFATVIIWKMLPISFATISQKMVGVLFAMLVNVIFLIASHYLLRQEGGWVGVKDTSYIDKQRALRKKKWAVFMQKFQNFRLVKAITTAPLPSETRCVMTGLYFIFFTVTIAYSTDIDTLKDNGNLVLIIYQIMIATGTVMAIYPIWPMNVKQKTKNMIIRIFYPIAMFYMMVFFSTFFVLLSDTNTLHYMIFAANIITLIVVMSWQAGTVMVIVGAYLAIQFYKYYMEIEHLDSSIGSPQFILIYSIVFIGSALMMFFKPKQEDLEQREREISMLSGKVGSLKTKIGTLDNELLGMSEQVTHYSQRASDQALEIERLGAISQKILNNVNHELRLPVGNVMNFAEMMRDGLGKLPDKQLRMISDEVYDNSNRLSTMILNMLDLATLDANKIQLQKREVNFSDLVVERLQICRKIYVGEKLLKFKLNIDPMVVLSIDVNYIRQMVDNLIINSINFSKIGLITIIVNRDGKFANFIIQDQGIGIPITEIYDVFTPFKMGSNTEGKAEGRGVGLALCKAAIEAHDGTIQVESRGVGVVFRVKLPFTQEQR